MKAVINNAEIRGVERKVNKKGEYYLLVRYEEDETGNSITIVDKELSRQEYYKKGTIMNLYVNIDIGKQFTNIRIIDARTVNK